MAIVDRGELVKVVKEMNSLDVTARLLPKQYPDTNDLVIKFLEHIEMIPPRSDAENKLSQNVIKMYNKLADAVEGDANKEVISFIERDPEPAATPAEIIKIADFVSKKVKVPSKNDLKPMKRIKIGLDGKDEFGFKEKSKKHALLLELFAGEKTAKQILYDWEIEKSHLNKFVKELKGRNKNIVIEKEDVGNEFIYRFFRRGKK